MRYTSVGAIVFLSAAMLHVGAAAEQAAERPLSRSLMVEQFVVYDVRPSARPAAASDAALEVLTWVDRPDYTYASGEEVQVFVETNKDAYVTVLNRPVPQPVSVGQLRDRRSNAPAARPQRAHTRLKRASFHDAQMYVVVVVGGNG